MEAMDQPSIDGINVWYASKAAAKLKLKVVFSGLGGDEIFFGYNHFKSIPFIFKYINIIKKKLFINYFLKFLFKIFAYIKKDDRMNILTESSNSIFDLWFLKRTLFTKKKIFKENCH